MSNIQNLHITISPDFLSSENVSIYMRNSSYVYEQKQRKSVYYIK